MIVLAGPLHYTQGVNLGDTICMFPVIAALGAMDDGPAYVAIQRPEVRELLPVTERVRLIDNLVDERAPAYRYQTVFRLNAQEAVGLWGREMHPTRLFAHQALGWALDGEPLQPAISVTPWHSYDFVVAPWTSDFPRRGWPVERWRELLANLRDHGTILVLGGRGDQSFDPGVYSTLYGAPLPVVAGAMLAARKAVITVDSMANRLAHAAGVKNHVLIASDVVPAVWAGHPGARMVHGPIKEITVDAVMGALAGVPA